MDKELCFVINEESLYLEVELINFNDVPIFFICKSCEEYYIALCTDINDAKYILIKTNTIDILDMLDRHITMRDLYSKVDVFWEIECGDCIEVDKATQKKIEEIDSSVLPIENEKYEIFDKTVKKYRDDLLSTIINSSDYRLYIKNFVSNYITALEKSFKNYEQMIETSVSQLNSSTMTINSVCFVKKNKIIKKDMGLYQYNYTNSSDTSDAA